MLHDQFIVTQFNATTGHGYVRHITSSDGSPLYKEPISFSVLYVAEYYCTPRVRDYGYRIPTREIVNRVPEVGTVIMGIVAHELDGTLSYDDNRSLFLRNWFYKDQLVVAFVMARINRVHDDVLTNEDDEVPPPDMMYMTVYGQWMYVQV